MVAPAILFALKALAPTAIRAAGKFLGGSGDKAAEVVADVIESGGDLEGAINSMPPDLRIELARVANEAQKLENERQARELEHDEKISGQIQATAQAEQQFGSEISKRVRPETARESFRLMATYSGLLLLLQAGEVGTSNKWVWFNEWTLLFAGLLAAPCMAYFGVRTFDKVWGKPGTVK